MTYEDKILSSILDAEDEKINVEEVPEEEKEEPEKKEEEEEELE